MTAYCKSCHCTHSAWSRLTNGYICGLCGARERDPQVTPVNAEQRHRLVKPMRPANGRPAERQ